MVPRSHGHPGPRIFSWVVSIAIVFAGTAALLVAGAALDFMFGPLPFYLEHW